MQNFQQVHSRNKMANAPFLPTYWAALSPLPHYSYDNSGVRPAAYQSLGGRKKNSPSVQESGRTSRVEEGDSPPYLITSC